MDTTAHASPPAATGPLSLHGLSVEGVNQCVHCGLCLAYCPTFSELGTEMDSPRGRIFIIKSLAEGRMSLSDSTVRHLSLCLDCRACETVCPAGVPYGRLIEAAKAEIERDRPGTPGRRLFRWLNFGLLLGHPRLLGLAASGARLYQASGLQRLVRKSGLVRLLPGTLPAWEALLPPVPSKADRAAPPPLTPAEGPRRARVALLTGCVQSVIFGAHNRATARVLAKNGFEVVVPERQGCCGALNAHGGDHERALAMARQTIDTFETARADAVVVNTSGCGAHMKAYGHLLADEAILGGQQVVRKRLLVEDVAELPIEGRPFVVADLQQSVLDAERVVDVLAEIMVRELDHPVVEIATVEQLQPLLVRAVVLMPGRGLCAEALNRAKVGLDDSARHRDG